jgi:alpha-1,3-rhamnosyl/mannosyltransferase
MGARVAARRADRIITGTQAAAEELVRCTSLPEGRIRVVPYGVDVPAPLTGNTDQQDDFLRSRRLNDVAYVLWVGSLEPRKGVGTLVGAMARLARGTGGSAPPACLVLAGYAGWHNTELVAPKDRDALGPALRQLGRVSEAELRALYAGAVLFAFPSLHEGFGLPVLEAMAAGVPVVASDIPAVREVAGGAATLVPAGDVAAWADVLGEMLGESRLSGPGRAGLVEAGRARAALFPWTATAAATLAVYEELVG